MIWWPETQQSTICLQNCEPKSDLKFTFFYFKMNLNSPPLFFFLFQNLSTIHLWTISEKGIFCESGLKGLFVLLPNLISVLEIGPKMNRESQKRVHVICILALSSRLMVMPLAAPVYAKEKSTPITDKGDRIIKQGKSFFKGPHVSVSSISWCPLTFRQEPKILVSSLVKV